MDNAEVEWRAHSAQIRRIKADAKKHHQEVLTTTNKIEDAIQKNNVIFAGKWEATHDCIDRHSEEVLLLKNRVIDLEALSGLQQTALQSCQNSLAGLEETIATLTVSVTKLHWGRGGLETNKNILSTLQALVEGTHHLPANNRLGTF